MHHERIAIIDYGSQYTRLITRRLRELGAFGLVYNSTATAAEIAGPDLKGVILSGGPNSVLEPGAPELDMAILRFLRRSPNRFVDLSPLAEEIGIDPFILQLTVERLHRRGLLQAPFIEPGTAGGAELTEKGLRWLLAQEGGKPSEVPVALKPATERVRAEAEAARLPRAQVYGVGR